MNPRGRLEATGLARVGACLFAIALLATPSLARLDHPLVHEASIHDEASHPNAAPHLDQEEHLSFDRCLGCLGGGHVADVAPRWTRSEPIDTAATTELQAMPLDGPTPLGGPPRAPPA